MQKIKVILAIAILGGVVYLGYDQLNKNQTTVTPETLNGQEIFGEAFLNSQQKTENQKAAEYQVNVLLSVEDNENDVLPPELEKLHGSIFLDYDFTNEVDASAEMLVEFMLNRSRIPNLGFMASLKEKALSFTLTNFDKNAGIFLGLDELLGGEEGIEMIRQSFVGKTQNQKLRDSEYRAIVQALTNPTEDSELIINTDEEDEAILQSFVDEQVVKINSAEKNDSGYLLSYSVESESIVNFLNSVAEINELEADFANELPTLQQISITGEMQITPEKNIAQIEGEILIERSLLDSAQKDLLFEFDYTTSENKDNFILKLVDAVKNTEQAQLEIDVQKN